MEVVSKLPRPTEPAAMERLLEAQRLLCARMVDEDDCLQAQSLLQELASPEEEGGFDYYPAFLTLASLCQTGFEPAIDQDEAKAAKYYVQLLAHEKSPALASDLLEDAATQLCNIVREQKSGFDKSDLARLEELGAGVGAGSLPFVASWVKFAAHDLDRHLREASEDPADRERRLAREAAREAWRAEELSRQSEAVETALKKAEELQLEGNDLCRQGQLPGNTKKSGLLARAMEFYGSAASVLTTCLDSGLSMVPDEANTVRRKRATLNSNAAQVCLSQRNWKEARRLSQASMEDDPGNSKSWFRLARAEIELREWNAAAKTIDEALIKSKGRPGYEADANILELWKLAEEVSKALPDLKWSSAKPPPKTSAEDYERRLIGLWEYGGGKYEIRLENWGALVFLEDTVRVDLMRKSKLSWRGDFEQIEGMAIVLSYEPGADMITTQFIAPPDCPEEQKYKGPTHFTSKRVYAPPTMSEPEPVEEETPTPAPAPVPPPAPPAPVEATPPPAPSIPDDAPRRLWLHGRPDVDGCYELVPDTLENERPLYRRSESLDDLVPSGDYYLWYRGGNWGVSKSLNASALAAPFLVRCGDNSGRSRHPMDVRRPRWYVRKGRGQEEMDSAISLSDSADCLGGSGYPSSSSTAKPVKTGDEGEEATSTSTTKKHATVSNDPPPRFVQIIGRQGLHEDVNGVYELTSSSSATPLYTHSEQRLFLFPTAGYWVVSPEVCGVPLALARCPSPPGLRSPLHFSSGWEFLREQRHEGRMVAMDTRTYQKDAGVHIQSHGSAGEEPLKSNAVVPAAEEAGPSSAWPDWVGDASVELSGGEVKAAVVVREGLTGVLKSLWLDVAEQVLKVGHPDQGTLSLSLPTSVDTEALPTARLSEKTRTLKVCLAVRT